MTESAATRRSAWRRWRVAWLAALAVPALLGALLLAAAHGALSRPLAALISEKLGRSFAAEGGIRIGLGRIIRIEADGVRLANRTWAAPADMLRARHVAIEIEANSLWHDTLVIRSLRAQGLELYLQRNAAGENNWSFALHPKGPSTVLPVLFRAVSIPGAQLSFAGPRLERPLEVSLATLEQQQDADGMLLTRAIGTANATPLELRIDWGPFTGLTLSRNFLVKARGHLGDIALGLDTRVDSLAAPADTQLKFSLEAPQASYLSSRLGLRDLGNGPVALALLVSPRAAGGGVQGSLTGQVGEFDVGAQGSLAVRAGVPAFSVQGHITGPDLSRVGDLAGLAGLPAEAFRLQLDADRNGRLLQLRHAVLELNDARLEADGPPPGRDSQSTRISFKASAVDMASVARRFGLVLPLRGPLGLDGNLRLVRSREWYLDCRGTTNYGAFSALGPIRLVSGALGTRLAWTASGGDLAPLATALRWPDPPRGSYRGKGDVEWTRDGLLLRGATVQGGGEAVTLSGKLGRPVFGRGTDLQLDVSGPSAARMAARFGYAGWPAQRYRVAGRIQRQPDRTLLSGVNAEMGEARLQVNGMLGDGPGLAATQLAFTISAPSLADFDRLLPDLAMPRGPFRASGTVSEAAGTLHFDRLQLAVGRANVSGSVALDLPMARRSLRYELDASVPEPAVLLPDSAWARKLGKQLQVRLSGARAGATWTLERMQVGSEQGLLSTQGALVVLPALSTTGTQVELRAASLRSLGTLLDRHWPELPVEVHARLSRSAQELQLAALAGKLGGEAFTGRVSARGSRSRPDLDIDLDFVQLDVDRLRAKTGGGSKPGAATVAADRAPARAAHARTRVIPDSEVSMPELGAYTGRLALRVGRLRVWGNDLTDFQVRSTLRGGRLAVDPLAATAPGGSVKLTGTLAAQGKGISVKLTGSGSDLLLRPVPIGFGGSDASRFSASVELRANGSRWSGLAATLNGKVRLVGRGGRMKNSLLLASSNGFVQQLLTGLNPVATRQPTTDVDCSAYLLRVKDGLVTTDPALVMRTREVDIVSAGAVDLRTEKIDFNFKIRARTGLGFGISQLVNPYLKVNGSLADPRVTLDPTGALVNGGAAVATAGLSVVATTLWDRFVHESDPCGAAVAESERRAAAHAGAAAQP